MFVRPEETHINGEVIRGMTLTGTRTELVERIKGMKALANGDILELHVGLWGVGDDKESRRPVMHFFRVKLNTDKPKPRAIVEPPPSAGEG